MCLLRKGYGTGSVPATNRVRRKAATTSFIGHTRSDSQSNGNGAALDSDLLGLDDIGVRTGETRGSTGHCQRVRGCFRSRGTKFIMTKLRCCREPVLYTTVLIGLLILHFTLCSRSPVFQPAVP